MKHLELTDIELGQIIEAVTVRCSETHKAAPTYSDELFEIIVKLKSALLCPAPVLVPSLDKSGAPLYLHASLDESVSSASVLTCDCGSTFYRDDLGSCYDCYFPSDSRDGE